MNCRKLLSRFVLILLLINIVNSVFIIQQAQASDEYPIADFEFGNISPAVGEVVICNISSPWNPEYPLVSFHYEIAGPVTVISPFNEHYLIFRADDVGWVTVTFTVWNTLGLSDTIQKSVYVNLVRADFTYFPSNPQVGEEITFDASNSENEIASYLWNFGDGTIESSVTPTYTHSYTSAGSYTVTLTVFSSSGTPFSKPQELIVTETTTLKKTPVLLLHGFQLLAPYYPKDIWTEMAEYLTGNEMKNVQEIGAFWKLEGINEYKPNVYISNYALLTDLPTLRSISFYASVLAQEIEVIKAVEGVNKIDIVAHSMGGLVARAYIESEDLGNPYGTVYNYDVRKLIMLGTPNHGDTLAYFAALLHLIPGFPTYDSIYDMQPSSLFMTHLNEGWSGKNLGVEYSTIAGRIFYWPISDGVVSFSSVTLNEVPYYRSALFFIDHSSLRNYILSEIAVKSILDTGRIPNYLLASLHSYAELRVYDSQGRVSGLVNGDITQDIPDSLCEDDTVVVFSPSGTYLFELFGIGTGSYTLDVVTYENEELVSFSAVELPITANEVHRYSVDWQALSQGEDGVTVQIDSDGDGVFEEVITADSDLTEAELMLKTETFMDLNPDTLCLRSSIHWITAYIELPEGYDYDVSIIDLASLRVNELIPAELKPTKIGDYNQNGVMDLMIKFSGTAVQEIVSVGEIELTISGNLLDGRKFQGKDTITIIYPP